MVVGGCVMSMSLLFHCVLSFLVSLPRSPPRSCVQDGMAVGSDGGQYDMAVNNIMCATESLFSSMGNAQEMVRQAKILAEATSSLVSAIKLEAENENDPGEASYVLGHMSCHVTVSSVVCLSCAWTNIVRHCGCGVGCVMIHLFQPAPFLSHPSSLLPPLHLLLPLLLLSSPTHPRADARRRLLDAAKGLAEATARMVEAAKAAARNPQDERSQEALRKAAEHLR